jgi:hypothetical protein
MGYVEALLQGYLHQLPVPCPQGHVAHALAYACVEVKPVL